MAKALVACTVGCQQDSMLLDSPMCHPWGPAPDQISHGLTTHVDDADITTGHEGHVQQQEPIKQFDS
jgi:hypothetical protein